jgi:hypothetical protein
MTASNFVEQAARKISDLGLTVPAILLLEAHKPVSFLGSQLMLIAQPTLELIMPGQVIQNTANLLANSEQVEQLIAHLEQQAKAGGR